MCVPVVIDSDVENAYERSEQENGNGIDEQKSFVEREWNQLLQNENDEGKEEKKAGSGGVKRYSVKKWCGNFWEPDTGKPFMKIPNEDNPVDLKNDQPEEKDPYDWKEIAQGVVLKKFQSERIAAKLTLNEFHF